MIIRELEWSGEAALTRLGVQVVLDTLTSCEVLLACRAWPIDRDRVMVLALCWVPIVARAVPSDVVYTCWACSHFGDDTGP